MNLLIVTFSLEVAYRACLGKTSASLFRYLRNTKANAHISKSNIKVIFSKQKG